MQTVFCRMKKKEFRMGNTVRVVRERNKGKIVRKYQPFKACSLSTFFKMDP